MTARRASGARLAPIVACLLALTGSAGYARHAWAGMYTWVDDEGDRHLVDSREKVPAKYRGKAREVGNEDAAAPTGNRSAPRGDTERAPSSSSESPLREAPRPPSRAAEKRASTKTDAGGSFWDRLRAARVAGNAHLPPLRPLLERAFPAQQLPRLALVAWLVALVVRAIHALRARRASRGLGAFADDYSRFVRGSVDRPDEARAAALESRLPRVHGWVRAAAVGPTTIGVSREVALGRVVDEGRLDVVTASLTRPGVVSAHTLAIVRRAQGVHRHRARRPFTPLGWLETAVFLPRYLVWACDREQSGALRVLQSGYWLWWLAWACAW